MTIDDTTGEVHVFAEKTVVDDVFDDSFEVSLEEAKEVNPAYELGDTLEIEVTPSSFGRIAAQTAKQVVVQRIREAERGVIYEQYADKEDEIMTGTILRQEKGCYSLELGRAEGILSVQRDDTRGKIRDRQEAEGLCDRNQKVGKRTADCCVPLASGPD